MIVKVSLGQEKIAIHEDTVPYEVTMGARGGLPVAQTGTKTLSAKLAGKAPSLCPERLSDLSWLAHEDAMCELAHEIVKQLIEVALK